MYIQRSPYFENFQNKKIYFCFDFVLQSGPATYRSMFSEANACAHVAGSGENCCELAGSLLYTTEKSRAV